MYVLVSPVHFRNVNQTFDTLLDFNECAVVSQVGYLTEHACALRVTTCQTMPGIVAHLLDTQGNTVLLLVKLQNFRFNFITNRQYFGWVLHATPCQISDVQQAVNTAQINECAVVGDVFNHAFNNCAFLQVLHHCFTISTLAHFQYGTTRYHHVVALAIQLDNLQFHRLVFIRRGVLNRTHIHQRTRQEGTDTVHHGCQTTFNFTADITFNDTAFFHRLLKINPGSQTLGFFTGKPSFAITIFQRFNCNGNKITNRNFQRAIVVAELLYRNETFRLQTRVYNHHALLDTYNLCSNQLSCTHFFACQALFEHRGKRFHC